MRQEKTSKPSVPAETDAPAASGTQTGQEEPLSNETTQTPEPLSSDITSSPEAPSDEAKETNESTQAPPTKKKLVSTFIFAFILTVFLMLAGAFLLLNAFGFHLLNVETGSMEPDLPVNSLIFVKPTAPEDIHSGDIITFMLDENGVLATHRVKFVHRNNRTFITKGDANDTDDPPVSWDQLVGRVVTHVPGIGGIFKALTSPSNRVVMIILLAVLVALAFSWDFIKGKLKKSGKRKAPVPEGTPPAPLPEGTDADSKDDPPPTL